jgi:alkanesulfonate monooxygenase SsuD/methylene tetrahydromethanopterin reductase-like flavin-dependent oxidoreductase (luciferase family)
VTGAMAAYAKRTSRDATSYFAIGDAQVIRDRVAAYVAVGIEKFILRPVGNGDEVIAQTRRLIEDVLPHI